MFKNMAINSLVSKLNSMPNVKRVGEIKDISLKNGRANAVVLLKGEVETVNVSFDYVINGHTLCVSNVKTSKPWLDGIAELCKDKYSAVDLSRYGILVDIAKWFV